MALLRKPKKAPTKVNGTETQNHKANKATKVKKGMAADDPSYHSTRFITKNRAKTTLKKKVFDEKIRFSTRKSSSPPERTLD